jgi:AraC-like DNA-binding protein
MNDVSPFPASRCRTISRTMSCQAPCPNNRRVPPSAHQRNESRGRRVVNDQVLFETLPSSQSFTPIACTVNINASHVERALYDISSGGLPPWQIRKLRAHVDAKLESGIGIKELAAVVNLSPHYFCRAFRRSLHQSPHAYVMERRIVRAKSLMIGGSSSLGQIAVECGLTDQSHLTKLFKRFVGQTPGAWRRMHDTMARTVGDPSARDTTPCQLLQRTLEEGKRKYAVTLEPKTRASTEIVIEAI